LRQPGPAVDLQLRAPADLFKPQRRILDADMLTPDARLQILARAIES
jgi:hypothetical protein